MNGRTIKRRLMENRANVMWGRRAFVTARLPLSVLPEPVPERPGPSDLLDPGAGWEEGFAYNWFRKVPHGDGTVLHEVYDVSKSYINFDPRKNSDEDDGPFVERHLIREREDRDWFIWWSGHRLRAVLPEGEDPDRVDYRVDWQEEPLPEEDVDRAMVWDQWSTKYLRGLAPMGEGTGNPVLDAFHDAVNAAKTTYPYVRGKYVYITYSVKWFYPRRKARFCADLHRAFRVARKHGVKAKLLHGA